MKQEHEHYPFGQTPKTNGPIATSENIFSLLAIADERIGQIESITLAIVQKVVGDLSGVDVEAMPKSPEPPSLRWLAKQNNERLTRVLNRLHALAKDLGT